MRRGPTGRGDAVRNCVDTPRERERDGVGFPPERRGGSFVRDGGGCDGDSGGGNEWLVVVVEEADRKQ